MPVLAERDTAFFVAEAPAAPVPFGADTVFDAAAFFAAGGDAEPFSGVVFFDAGTTAFLAAPDAPLALFVAAFRAVEDFSVAGTARFEAGAAFVTSRFASFLVSDFPSVRLGTVAPALLDEFVVPAPDFGAAVGRAVGAFLTEVPLLAGVIVPPSGPPGVTRPRVDLSEGAGDDSGPLPGGAIRQSPATRRIG